jgi:cytochrome c oxidase subunit 2
MNKYELRIIAATGILLMSFLFAVLYAAYAKKIDVPACIPYNATFKEPRVKQVDDKTYEVYAVARMWSFEPAQIELPVGSTVDFYLTSNDVVHGFDITDKGVNMMAVYGAVNKSTVKFDKPGVYKITCHEYCGAGHQNMQAEIIVNYKN